MPCLPFTKRSLRGFSLLEMMVVIAVSAALITVAYSLFSSIQRSAFQQQLREQALTSLRQQMDGISKQFEVRSMDSSVGLPTYEAISGLAAFSTTPVIPCQGLRIRQFLPPNVRTIEYTTQCANDSSAGGSLIPFSGDLASLSLGGADFSCGPNQLTVLQTVVTIQGATTTTQFPAYPATNLNFATWMCFRFLSSSGVVTGISMEGMALYGSGSRGGKVELQQTLSVQSHSSTMQYLPKF